MSRRKPGPGEPAENSNVVKLQPASAGGGRNDAATMPSEPAPNARTFQSETMTREGLDLLKAFFAIDDAAARAALVMLAQRLASHPSKG